MVNYQNTKIYKLQPIGGGKVYIGATTKNYLSQRMDSHRKNFKMWKSNSIHIGHTRSFDLFDEYGIENCEIILIENFPCNSKEEQSAREAYYIQSIECVNKTIPGRTKEQWKMDN